MIDTSALRATLAAAFRDAIGAIDLRGRVREAIGRAQPGAAIVAIGKAAPAMAAGALDAWPGAPALVVTTDGTDASCVTGRAELLRAAHPVPDARSLTAGARALEVARAARGTLLVLVSGGASALVEALPPGLDPPRLAELVGALVDSGATIREVNAVRRHLSRVKGGRLALASGAARVVTLIASDVPGGAPHDVGSGPSVVDPTSVDDARAAVARALGADAARDVAPWLEDGLRPGDPRARDLDVRTIARPRTLADAAAAALRRAGLDARADPDERTAPAADLLERYAAMAASLAPGSAVALACEPVLRVDAPGRGGRAGWLALALLDRLPDGVAFLAGASDGVDGRSPLAGACVARDVPHDRAAIARALATFSDADAHAAMGTGLAGGPTGVNLTDVHLLARAPAA